jgi:hypothetical protein
MPTLTELAKEAISKNPNKTSSEIAKEVGCSQRTARQARMELTRNGNVSKQEVKEKAEGNTQHTALTEECDSVGIPLNNVKHYWHKGQHFSIFVKNKEVDLWELKDKLIEEMKDYSPKYPTIKYPKIKDGHLLVIDPADIHISKLCKAFETGDEYNHKIAIERVKSGVAGILNKVKGFPIDQILFVVGNDILHVDNARSSTTSGTPQDTEIMWYEAFTVAKNLLVECVEMLMTVAPVHIQYDPSNHDYVSGFMLAQTLEAWFRNCESCTFDVSIAHRKYFSYGKNLIGTTHGDGAKEADLPLLMAHESKDWNNCKHRYFYVHHLHHKRSRDYMSVCVETLRSPSGTDSWHHRNGYTHAPKAIEAFVHCKEHGQIARITHLF